MKFSNPVGYPSATELLPERLSTRLFRQIAPLPAVDTKL
jgi:hypothetical protein